MAIPETLFSELVQVQHNPFDTGSPQDQRDDEFRALASLQDSKTKFGANTRTDSAFVGFSLIAKD